MDPEAHIKGCPYGGVGFICAKMEDISYRVVNCESNRVCAVQVLHSGSMLETCLVYTYPSIMGVLSRLSPTGIAEQIESYMDTLNKVQCLIDIYGESTPDMVTGDFNPLMPGIFYFYNLRMSILWCKHH